MDHPLWDVLNRHLSASQYLCADEYTIADIAIWPWYGILLGGLYEAAEFLDVQSYTHVNRWASAIRSRPAVQRGRMLNRTWGPLEEQLHERHDASDFETRTQDKLTAMHASAGNYSAGRFPKATPMLA